MKKLIIKYHGPACGLMPFLLAYEGWRMEDPPEAYVGMPRHYKSGDPEIDNETY